MIFSRPCGTFRERIPTQDYVLGYTHPSLRDSTRTLLLGRSRHVKNHYQRNPNVTGNMFTVPVPTLLFELVGEFTQT